MNVEAVEKVVDEFISMLEMAPYIRPAGGSEDFIQSFIPFAIRVRERGCVVLRWIRRSKEESEYLRWYKMILFGQLA